MFAGRSFPLELFFRLDVFPCRLVQSTVSIPSPLSPRSPLGISCLFFSSFLFGLSSPIPRARLANQPMSPSHVKFTLSSRRDSFSGALAPLHSLAFSLVKF